MANILMLEDHEEMAKTLKFFLEQGGHQVEIVRDCENLIQTLDVRSEEFDLVLAERKVPFRVRERARDLESWVVGTCKRHHIPLIGMSLHPTLKFGDFFFCKEEMSPKLLQLVVMALQISD